VTGKKFCFFAVQNQKFISILYGRHFDVIYLFPDFQINALDLWSSYI